MKLKFLRLFALAALGILTAIPGSTQPLAVRTWNGLTFGMPMNDAITALKALKLNVVTDSDHPDEVLKVDGDMGAAAGSAKLFFPPPQHRLDDIVLEFDFGLRTTVAEKERDEARVGGVGDHEAFRRAYTMGRIAEDYLERYGEPFFAETDGDFPINSKNEKWKDGYINHDPWTSSIKWKWREGGQQVEFYGLLIVRSGRIEVEYSPDVHKF